MATCIFFFIIKFLPPPPPFPSYYGHTQLGLIRGGQLEDLEDALVAQYQLLSPVAGCVVDAFDFPDEHLESELGRRDGRVFEGLWRYAMASSSASTVRDEDVARILSELPNKSRL